MSLVLDEKGQYTPEFASLLKELEPQFVDIKRILQDWLVAEEATPADSVLVGYLVRELVTLGVELELLFRSRSK